MNTSSYSAESILRSCLQTAEKQDGLPCKNIVFSNSSRIRRKRKFYYIIFFGVCVGGFKNFFGFLEIWCEMLEMEGHGAGNFAVCGQRLRGHVPSKNTSPAALSWISLFGATVLKSFCSCPMRSKTKKDTAHRVPSPHRTPQNEKMPESLCFRAFESGDPYGN